MFNLTMLAVLILASVFIKSTLTDRSYCLINTEHTMCKYKATSPNCVLYSTQDQVETAQMLNDHNAARNAYAAGSQGFLIPNMLKMYWDQELADISSMWACQCESTKDKNRDVPRFRVGQIVWSEVRQKQFTTWEKLWKKILHSSGGFYIRDIVGNLRIQFNSHHPLSYIYNPSVNFVGCTLAKHRIWSLSFGELVYSTTLVCNYGPIKEYYSSEQTYEEDWPCRACPLHKPCFTEHFWVKTLTSNKLVLERNLCVDAELESSIILPGKGCPSSLRSQNLFLTEGRQFSGDGSSASNDDLSLNVLDINDENLKDVMDNITNLETESIGDVMQLNPGMLDVNGKVDYCSLTCDNAVNHTMCVYQNESPQCSGFLSLMNTAVKDDLVKLHNDFRNDFARGEIPRAYPLASNMMLMEWKEELQVTAHRWISQCNLSHDSCRDHLFHDPRPSSTISCSSSGPKRFTSAAVTLSLKNRTQRLTSFLFAITLLPGFSRGCQFICLAGHARPAKVTQVFDGAFVERNTPIYVLPAFQNIRDCNQLPLCCLEPLPFYTSAICGRKIVCMKFCKKLLAKQCDQERKMSPLKVANV